MKNLIVILMVLVVGCQVSGTMKASIEPGYYRLEVDGTTTYFHSDDVDARVGFGENDNVYLDIVDIRGKEYKIVAPNGTEGTDSLRITLINGE